MAAPDRHLARGRAEFDRVRAAGGDVMAAALAWIRTSFDEEAIMTGHINNPMHWHDRADELRAVADDFKDEKCKEQLLRCADDYDKMGDRAAQRADGKVAS